MVIMNLNEFDIDIGTIVEPESQNRKTLTVVLVALYRYQNFAIRILHSLMENINGVKVHTVFLSMLIQILLTLQQRKKLSCLLRLYPI